MRVISILVLLVLGGCSSEEARVPEGKRVLRGEAMGTGWSVVFPQGEWMPDGVRERIVEAIEEVEGSMSAWIEDSEVSRFKRLGGGEAMEISAGMVEVVGCGLEVWEQSGGAFDITVGSGVVGGSKWLVLDRENRTLTKTKGGILIDLSAVAKGYAVDRVAEVLERAGVENCLVEIGGELRGVGVSGDGKKWRVGVESPVVGGSEIAGTVELSGEAVATSGNYRKPKHLVDPETGKSVERELMSVCVVHKSAMMADAWATAFFVLGEEKGRAVAKAEGIRVAFVREGGELVFVGSGEGDEVGVGRRSP